MTPLNKHLPTEINEASVERIVAVTHLSCLSRFSPVAVNFLCALSSMLLKEERFKPFPELLALGFWLRSGNLKRLQHEPRDSSAASRQLFVKPLGTVLHICPGNVDTMFVYSWACSLLVGNNNIVRTPSVVTDAQQTLLDGIAKLFVRPEFEDVAQRNVIANWSQDSEVTALLSQKVQARMIWGGDETISRIRSLPVAPGCRDLTFADKFSASVLSLNGLSEQQLDMLAELLWRDMNTFQQAACSSPKVLIFCNTEHNQKHRLYENLQRRAQQLVCEPATSVNHLVAKQLLLSQHSDNRMIEDGPLPVVKVQRLGAQEVLWHPAQNFLYEYEAFDLKIALSQLPENCQTVSHFGFTPTELNQALVDHKNRSVDRLVPVGQALNFSEYWDGYDLLKQLCRTIELRV